MDWEDSTNKFGLPQSGYRVFLPNESGYGSMGRVLHSPTQDNNMSIYQDCSFTSTKGTGYGKRSLTIETIKRKLFVSSPYIHEGKSPNDTPVLTTKFSQKSAGKIRKKLNFETPIKGLQPKHTSVPVAIALKETDAEPSPFKSPIPVGKTFKESQPKGFASPSIKFYYTPIKDAKLFLTPTPSPVKSVIPKTRKSPSSKWLSFDLPEKRCDILKKLAMRNMTHSVSTILSLLSGKDICRACFVSKAWRKIVTSDVEAVQRRTTCLVGKMAAKENRTQSSSQAKEHIPVGNLNDGDREILMELDNRESFKPVFPKAPTLKSDCFFEVAKGLPKSEVILKCPMCQYPAKCINSNQFQCIHNSCTYRFCRQCFQSHGHTIACPSQNQSVPKVIIGSKKSKRNLRRL